MAMCERIRRLVIVWCLLSASGVAQESAAAAGTEPVAEWLFDEGSGGLASSLGGWRPADVRGVPVLQSAGPRPPEFPDFSQDNRGLQLDGRSWLQFADDGSGRLNFAAGEAISLEAWVRTSVLKDGQQVYLIGKGRTGRPGVKQENQSWALRLRGMGGTARVSFLFRSADVPAGVNAEGRETEAAAGELHRWNSSRGFAADGEWHHVAVSFRFGSSESPVAWIDGEPTDGSWDLGGRTSSRAPYVDDDQVWIGSSMGGNPESSFQGVLDGVAVWRRMLTDADVSRRWRTTRRSESLPELAAEQLSRGVVTVDVREYVKQSDPWNRERTRITTRWEQPVMALSRLPRKYIDGGLIGDRSNSCVVRLRTVVSTEEQQTRVLVRARSAARLLIDGREVAKLNLLPYASDGHQEVPVPPEPLYAGMHPVQAGDQEVTVEVSLATGEHVFELETLAGGKSMRVELGETVVALGSPERGFEVLSAGAERYSLDESGWRQLLAEQQQFLVRLESEERVRQGAEESAYWTARHAVVRDVIGADAAGIAAADVDRLLLKTLADEGLQPRPLVDDLTFLRRLALGTVGVIPTPEERQWFLSQPSERRRALAVDRYLADPRWADHWVSYWQDVLAENPGILKPELNNTGPFRWWIYESFLDNRPTDRFATELVMMRGSRLGGGPAGFAMASQNDVPLAERSIVLGAAFGARNLKCARCHDSPVNEVSQKQLFEMAALLNRGAISIPATSSVPKGPDGERNGRVTVSIEPGTVVSPAWTFGADASGVDPLWQRLLRDPGDSREQLALHLTHPVTSDFARVMVNRLWSQLFGQGLLRDQDDWSGGRSVHGELLELLGRQHMAVGYDLKATARLLLLTDAWQRESAPEDAPVARLFGAVTLRRMTAEQMVDSLYAAVGKGFDAELLTLDPEGRRPDDSFLNLGQPQRAWQLCSLSNERDRPALALPVAQSLVDLLTVFGWRDSRPHGLSVRDDQATVLQPLTLANGNAGHRLVQFSDNSAATEAAVAAESPEQLVRELFRQLLTREPSVAEVEGLANELRAGFSDRLVPGAVKRPPQSRRNSVSWSNHLNSEATRQKQQQEESAREGDPPTERLREDWRLVAEDVVWVLLNSPEFVFVP